MDITNIKKKSESDMDYYNTLSKQYFERHKQPIQKYSTNLESRWLRKLIMPFSRVLLIGSGGGRELPPLLENKCSIVALDYSKGMIDLGKQKWGSVNIKWVLGDTHDLSKYRNSFDYVISLAALNYFVDINLALLNMSNVLLQGGIMIVSSINADHPCRSKGRKSNKRFFENGGLR